VAMPLASSVSSGLERQIRRVLSVVLLLSLIELVVNATTQSNQLNNLSTAWLALLAFTTLATVLSSWLTSGTNQLFLTHGLISGTSLIAWPLMLSEMGTFSQGMKPWIWWTLGIGILSFGLFVNWWLGGIYLLSVSAGWSLLTMSQFGGAAQLSSGLQDAVYLFLFGGSIIGMINLVRRGAKRADVANSMAIESAIEQARIDAVERERQRLDALIHDRVLNTLLLSGKAETAAERKSAVKLAENAILSLQEALVEPRSTPSVTPLGLFRALRKAALQLLPVIEVRTMGGGSEEISAEKAQAITQATLQAIDNAARHASATSFELVMDSPVTGAIEIVVRDNGSGFRLDKLPKDRIGLRTSVIARMEAIGGYAKISSAGDRGTEIKLGWSA
jgi:signal transduction histidine kinase